MGEITQFDSISGYLARPAEEGPSPAVIVIQEWWGLNDQIKSVYKPEAAGDAWQRLTKFLARNLN